MKRLLLLLSVCCLMMSRVVAQSTLIPNPDNGNFQNNLVNYNGTLYGSYTNQDSKTQLIRFNGTSWTQIANPDAGTGFYTYIDKTIPVFNGALYGSYINDSGVNQLMKYDGNAFTSIPITGVSAPTEILPIGVYNGELYIYYSLPGPSVNHYRIAKYDGNTWTLLDNPPGYEAYYDEGFVFNRAVFFRYTLPGSGVHYLAKYDGSTVSIIPNPEANPGQYGGYTGKADVIIFNNNLYVGYTNYTTNHKSLTKYTGNELSVIADPTGMTGYYGFAIEFNGAIYGLYQSASGLRLAKCDGTTWTLIANPNPAFTTGEAVWPNSLTIYNNKLTLLFSQGSSYVNNFYSFDGTNWANLGGPGTYPFNVSFSVINGTLYSVFKGNGTGDPSKMGKYDGSSWTTIVDPVAGEYDQYFSYHYLVFNNTIYCQYKVSGTGKYQMIQLPSGTAPPTPLTLTPSASPATLLTTGTTTLIATVSGGTSPYSYTFSGPGTITPSGNTATVSGLPAGVQTFTVVASDATTPTSQSVSGTVSVTVTQANTAPTVANAIPPQSATVGQAFSYVIPATTFTDAETPNGLTLSVSGLPAGLAFSLPATISGTPTATGNSTVTVKATDPGNLSVSTSFSLSISEAATLSGCTSLLVTGSDIGGSGGNGTYMRIGTTNSYTLAGSNSLCQGMSVSGKYMIYFDAGDNRWEWSIPGCGQFLKNDNIPANGVPPETGWTTNSGFMLGITPGTVSCNGGAMPVRLISFVGRLTNTKAVELSWETSWEQNAAYFSVERSTDLKSFQSIAQVKASGNSTALHDYSLTDEIPLPGLSYYRLNQVDLDGTSHVYPAVSIRTEGTDVLYPNPSNGTFVNLDVAATSVIELFTLTGESLPFERKKASESNVQLLPEEALAPGIYLIRVNGITRKWVVQ